LRRTGSNVLDMSKKSIDLSSVDRESLPIGVSSVVASRMRLDAMGSPALLSMRMNYRNLLNEMTLNQGRIVSHQYALMKPRPKSNWQRPTTIQMPENTDPDMLKRVTKRRARQERDRRLADMNESQRLLAEEAKQATLASTTKIFSEQDDADLGVMGQDEADALPAAVTDPTAALEVQELMNESHVREAFKALEDRHNIGYMPESRLPRSLEALGYEPDKKLLKKTIQSLVRYKEFVAATSSGEKPGIFSLAFDEFCAVVNAISTRRSDLLRDAFKSLDRDCSGTISMREFRHLLWDLGFTVTETTVREIFEEVDADKSGVIELPEFEEALQVVHDRHGFTTGEADDLLAIFDRYDTDRSGQMSSHELASALGWFGQPTTIQQAKDIIYRFDKDASATLCRCEFLMVMRSRLEDENSDLRSLFAEFDTQSKGALSGEQLSMLFQRMGYTIPYQVVQESIAELGPASTIMGLVFEDVCKLLTTIRKREGFSKSELDELMVVYKQSDRQGSGELREFELAHCLNWLGYPISHARRRKLWCIVDVDKNNFIDPGEFLKLVRLLREEETSFAKKLLEISAGQGMPREKDVKDMLFKLGYHPAPAVLSQALKEMGAACNNQADIFSILGLLRSLREGQVAGLRESAGLSDTMAQKVRGKFRLKLDAGKRIDPTEFERFMYELFKGSRTNTTERDKIKQLVRDHCVRGQLGLHEMFWVVRLYEDSLEEEKLEREKTASQSVGFSEQQVAQFRQAFVEADLDGSGELSEQEILILFEDIVSLNASQVSRLHMELEELGPKKDAIDFTEFVRILGLLVNSDHSSELRSF